MKDTGAVAVWSGLPSAETVAVFSVAEPSAGEAVYGQFTVPPAATV